MKRFFAILLVAVLLLSMLPATSMAAKYGTVVGGWLRLRSAPNFNASTITSYYTGTVVEITGTSGGWYRVYTPDGRSGYMYGQYLKVGSSSSSGSSSGDAYVTSHNGYGVRLRKGPGTGYRVIASYEVGTPVKVLERGSYWSKISIAGTVGYMMTQYLSFNGGYYDDDDDGKVECYATIWSRNGYGVRLRKGPSKDYGTIGTYSVGTTVAVLDKGSTWDKIRVGSRVGYMMNEFLDYHNTNEVTSVTLNTYSPAVGTVLGVKAISPSKATVAYEWRVNGVSKGTASTYTVTSADVGYQIQLKVTGTGSYTGSAKSEKTNKVLSNTQISDVVLNTTAPVVGNVLKATVTPASAKVIYAWIVGDTQVSNADSYTVKADDVNKVIKLIVTGTGDYSGGKTITTSAVTATGTLTGVSIANTTNTASGAAPAVDDVLQAVTSPSQAVAAYQWMADNANISGATSKTFKLTADQVGKKISVKASAAAPYIGGTVTSSATQAVIAKPTAPTITTTVLDNGTKNTPYTQTLQASGSTPITWSISKDELPAGLTLDASAGTISGTPTAAGTFTFTVKATNAAMQADTQELSITIIDPNPAAPKLEIGAVDITLTEGYKSEAVAITIENTGDADATITSVKTEDDNFVVTAGNTTIGANQTDKSWKITPPEGVSPRVATKTITVKYNDGKEATATLTMTVKEKESGSDGTGEGGDNNGGEENTAIAPEITTAGTASAKAGETITLNLTATGTGNLTWTVESTLPGTLQLNGSAITGKVDTAGDYTISVKVASDDEKLEADQRADSKDIVLTVTEAQEDTMPPAASTYTVTVVNGTCDKESYSAGDTVTIKATDPTTGNAFDEWVFTEGSSTFASSTSSTTTFTMPSANVTVKATYKEITYHLDVLGGGTDGDYAPGTEVTIFAGSQEGQVFTRWEVQSGGANLDSETANPTSFIMPNSDVVIKAILESAKYTVEVSGGSGGGSYQKDETVTVSLKTEMIPENKKFSGWEIIGVDGLSSSSDESFSFSMPAGSVTVKAKYETVARTLDDPTGLRWDGDTAIWDAVDGAESYMFYSYKKVLNGGEGGTTNEKSVGSDTSYTFTGDDLQAGDKFYIKAIGNGVTTYDSDYSTSPDHP